MLSELYVKCLKATNTKESASGYVQFVRVPPKNIPNSHDNANSTESRDETVPT